MPRRGCDGGYRALSWLDEPSMFLPVCSGVNVPRRGPSARFRTAAMEPADATLRVASAHTDFVWALTQGYALGYSRVATPGLFWDSMTKAASWRGFAAWRVGKLAGFAASSKARIHDLRPGASMPEALWLALPRVPAPLRAASTRGYSGVATPGLFWDSMTRAASWRGFAASRVGKLARIPASCRARIHDLRPRASMRQQNPFRRLP